MAKKTLWKDNTMPPTNYIWMRTNENGEMIGIYEYVNGRWTRIDYSVAKKVVGTIVFGQDSEGNLVELPIGDGSVSFESVVGYNTAESGKTPGTITAVTPTEADPDDTVVTIGYVNNLDPKWSILTN